ncbi:xylulokinase [Thermofilum pendens]|uniref:Glycerol kinase n=1 Tax=Thermofilum pendens (strain DSM 2475 / Hrk 5) TaxID=368408 RepID=A1RYL5_THEPD|nr:FGGY-family carbohydrate kinase [Thermofilum pendens]ABL78295.1 Glycerol kinase [Thermofilum pendens Hrk 5]
MSGDLLLSIDIGTTTVKAGLFHSNGSLLALDGKEYPTYYPRPGWAEQDPDDWWRTSVEVARNVLKKAGVDPSRVAGICVSSQRETLALVDSEGRSLGRVPIWMDRRSSPQAERIKSRVDPAEIYRKTGLVVDATFTATKLLWYKENEPEVLRRARLGLQPKDYVVYRLTGVAVTDHTVASRTMLFNIVKLEWDRELFEELGLSEYAGLFPESRYSDEVVGTLSEEASRLLGLPRSVQVLAGMGDRQAEVLGAGIFDSRRVEESTGTGSTTATMVDSPLLDEKMRFSVGAAPIRGRWVVEAGMSTAGAILRWFRDQVADGVQLLASSTRRRAYEYLDMEAAYVPPGSNGLIVLPFFSGARSPRWNPYARGVIFGLTVYHTRAHIFRAMMEGIAYEIRKILEVFAEVGVKPGELILMGGGAKSPLWARIKANVTKMEVVLPELLDAALAGDAMLASLKLGLSSSHDEAAKKFFREKARIKPDPRESAIYDSYYSLYERLVSASEAFFAEISSLGEATPTPPPWDIEKLVHLLFKLEETNS